MPLCRSVVTVSVFLGGLVGCSSSGDDKGGGGDASSATPDAPVGPDVTSPSDAHGPTDGGGGADRTDAGPADDGGASDATTPPDSPAPDDAGPPCATDGGLPDELRCTGLYSDWSTQTIADDAYYYGPGFKLWSDGAAKRRWIQLPPNTEIDTSDMDDW